MIADDEATNDTTPAVPELAREPGRRGKAEAALRGIAAGAVSVVDVARARWRLVVVVVATLAAAGSTVGLFFFQFRPDRQIDGAAADAAVRAATDGAVALLSYSSDTLDRDFADAKSYLTGDLLAHYDTFTAGVAAPAVKEKHLVQRAVVVRAAAAQISQTSAVILAFVDEKVTSAGRTKPLITPGAVRLTLEKVDGTWLISKLEPVG